MEQVRDCFNDIDSLLKQDCIFCGTILIDMIDNDLAERPIDVNTRSTTHSQHQILKADEPVTYNTYEELAKTEAA